MEVEKLKIWWARLFVEFEKMEFVLNFCFKNSHSCQTGPPELNSCWCGGGRRTMECTFWAQAVGEVLLGWFSELPRSPQMWFTIGRELILKFIFQSSIVWQLVGNLEEGLLGANFSWPYLVEHLTDVLRMRMGLGNLMIKRVLTKERKSIEG